MDSAEVKYMVTTDCMKLKGTITVHCDEKDENEIVNAKARCKLSQELEDLSCRKSAVIHCNDFRVTSREKNCDFGCEEDASSVPTTESKPTYSASVVNALREMTQKYTTALGELGDQDVQLDKLKSKVRSLERENARLIQTQTVLMDALVKLGTRSQ